MGSQGREAAESVCAVMVAGRSSGEGQHGGRGGRQPLSVPACMARLQTNPPATAPGSGKSLCGFWSLCSQTGLLFLQILIRFQAVLGKHKRENIIWGRSGILQKVTFLERTLEPDVPLKSICGQGLCWETNCYKGKKKKKEKKKELQHTEYKKKLQQG